MTPAPTPPEAKRSFLRTNLGLVYLALAAAVPAFIVSLPIGLNPGFTAAILVLFVIVAYGIGRWRSRRRPSPSPCRPCRSSRVAAVGDRPGRRKRRVTAIPGASHVVG